MLSVSCDSTQSHQRTPSKSSGNGAITKLERIQIGLVGSKLAEVGAEGNKCTVAGEDAIFRIHAHFCDLWSFAKHVKCSFRNLTGHKHFRHDWNNKAKRKGSSAEIMGDQVNVRKGTFWTMYY
jgi:hypothetical protein